MPPKVLTNEQMQSQLKQTGKPPAVLTDAQMKSLTGAPSVTEKPKTSTLGKVAGFLAPTATESFRKAQAGEDVSTREKIGSILEVGSYLLPVGAIARGVGLAGKGALTLGRKLATGAVAGGLGAGTFEAGRAIGDEDATALNVIERTGRGLALGTGFGAALPLGFAGVRSVGRIPQATRDVTRATQQAFGTVREKIPEFARKSADVVSGITESATERLGRIPRRIGQASAEKAERARRMAVEPEHIKQAIKHQIEDPVIEFVKTGTATDKIQRVKMLEIAKKGKEDFTFLRQAKELPGETIVQGPASYLIKIKDQGVAKTEQVLNKLGTAKQNARRIYDQFITDMTENGVIVQGGKLVPMRGSRIPDGDLKFYQQVFNELRPDKRGITPLSFREMHGLRQKWFDVARSDKTFTGGTTSYARRLRSLLAQPIDQASKGKYLQSQTQTREALEGLGEFVKLMGHKGKIENITSRDLKAGEVFSRIFGNAADRPNKVLDTLYDTARKYGYKGQENVKLQLRFADFLEDIYGSPQTRSLRGQVARGVSDVDPASLAREATKWSPVAAAMRLTRNLSGLRPEDVVRAFENMVRAEAGQKIPTVFGRKTQSLGGVARETLEETKKLFNKSVPKGKGAIPKTIPKEITGPGTYKVVRQHTEKTANTDTFRGGTWHQTDIKNYDFAPEKVRGVGGEITTKSNVAIKNPFVVDDAILEDGSFAVINNGYEKILPSKERGIANKIAEIMYPGDAEIGQTDKLLRKYLTENGNTSEQIKNVLSSTNKVDAAMDLVISKGLKAKGYDSLVLSNKFKGKVLDQHVFKFADLKSNLGNKK